MGSVKNKRMGIGKYSVCLFLFFCVDLPKKVNRTKMTDDIKEKGFGITHYSKHANQGIFILSSLPDK